MADEPQGTEEKLPPYVIEGARSSRSRCKTCRRKINKGTPRIGMLIEGPFGTGYLWHHINCAARRQFERVEEAYRLEAWNEAKEPLEKVPDLAELAKMRSEADEKKSQRKELPYAEPAPTGRAKCKSCGETIEKDSLRVTLGRLVEFGNQVRTTPINVHPRCVVAEIDAEDCGTEREGFNAALRANSGDVAAERIDAVIAEIGIS
jgi:hypothetical protein